MKQGGMSEVLLQEPQAVLANTVRQEKESTETGKEKLKMSYSQDEDFQT